MMACSLLSARAVEDVPLVDPRSRMCQMPLNILSTQCLPETLSKSNRMSQPARRPIVSSDFKSGIGSPPPTGIKVPRTSRWGCIVHSFRNS